MFIFDSEWNEQKTCRLLARSDLQLPETYDKDSIANTIHYQALMPCLKAVLEEELSITQLDILFTYLYTELEEEL